MINENLRKKISDIYDNTSIILLSDKLIGIKSIEVISKPIQGVTCLSHVLGVYEDINSETVERFQKISETIEERSVGNIVWYFIKNNPKHFAIVESEGMVTSRWGEGPLLRHPENLVPYKFGEPRNYSKPLTKEQLKKVIKIR